MRTSTILCIFMAIMSAKAFSLSNGSEVGKHAAVLAESLNSLPGLNHHEKTYSKKIVAYLDQITNNRKAYQENSRSTRSLVYFNVLFPFAYNAHFMEMKQLDKNIQKYLEYIENKTLNYIIELNTYNQAFAEWKDTDMALDRAFSLNLGFLRPFMSSK